MITNKEVLEKIELKGKELCVKWLIGKNDSEITDLQTAPHKKSYFKAIEMSKRENKII